MSYKNKYKNTREENFKKNIPTDLVAETKLASFVKFNTKYLDPSRVSEGFLTFSLLTEKQRNMIFDKIKEFSGNSKKHWETVATLGIHNVLEKYSDSVLNAKCVNLPKHVPVDVEWYRWRLEKDFRLIGFFVSKKRWREEVEIDKEHFFLDPNTFYLVYIDPEHHFYKTK